MGVTAIILLFLKYPEPGRVKTRLAATIGAAAAAGAYRRMVAHVCSQLNDLPDAPIAVFYDPPEDRQRIIDWISPLLNRRFRLAPQVAGNLGDRLADAFATVFDQGASRAIVIGTDCVELDTETLGEAMTALDHSRCVIGPTTDGGYYLMGLRRPMSELFANISWSTSETLAQTLDCARSAGIDVTMLPPMHDVDVEADWDRAQRRLAMKA